MKIKQVLACVLLSGLSTLALGKPAKQPKVKPVKTAQVYVLGQVGVAKLDAKHANFKENFGVNGRIGIGYLTKYNKKISYGVEAGLMKYAKYTHKERTYTETLSGYSCDLLGVVKYKLNKKYNAFGKTGVSYMRQGYYSKLITVKTKDYRPELQLGLGYKLSKKMEASVSYSVVYGKREQKNVKKLVTLPLHSVMVGLQYEIV